MLFHHLCWTFIMFSLQSIFTLLFIAIYAVEKGEICFFKLHKTKNINSITSIKRNLAKWQRRKSIIKNYN